MYEPCYQYSIGFNPKVCLMVFALVHNQYPPSSPVHPANLTRVHLQPLGFRSPTSMWIKSIFDENQKYRFVWHLPSKLPVECETCVAKIINFRTRDILHRISQCFTSIWLETQPHNCKIEHLGKSTLERSRKHSIISKISIVSFWFFLWCSPPSRNHKPSAVVIFA